MNIRLKFLFVVLTICVALSNKSSFKIEGMVCEGGCSYKVKSIVSSIEGVNECSLDFAKKVLTVNYDSKIVNDQLIIEKISQDKNFKAEKIKTNKKNKRSWLRNWF